MAAKRSFLQPLSQALPLSSRPEQFGSSTPYENPMSPRKCQETNSDDSIYQEAKPATQSGDWRGRRWRMDWDILPKGHRWENPLIGWQSSGDFMQGTHINFESKEDAIHFAEKQGYEYFVQEPNSRKFAPKAYANNFLYSARKLKHIRTK
jgi:hypothetical protein